MIDVGGIDTLWGAFAVCSSALALVCTMLAMRWGWSARSLASQAASSAEVRRLLEQNEAQAALWKSAAKALEREVSMELDRVESRRKAAAAVESRLKAREQQTDETIDPTIPQPTEEWDRARLRQMRREAGG